MKKMNIVRATFLVAIMTFLGAFSVSAQAFYPPTQAMATIETTLQAIGQAPSIKSLDSSGNPTNVSSFQVSAPAVLTVLKISYLQEVLNQLKAGQSTQAAINTVYTLMTDLPGMSSRPSDNLEAVRSEVIDLLSN